MSDRIGGAPAPRPAKADSRIHICSTCKSPGAPCGTGGDRWFCVEHAPPSYWPHNRAAGQ